ncbi:IS4 family transposase [Salibacterium halotolerans]|uniref:Transposase DDE domain-containing protein n=1 Tax=Salibacterium halotolerans TaxID=1884432 RepID=A0A1I5L439_9BACI|nr:IS4 family transposase [Salibacterium halotolerans]SFO92057.1 Transposase DDE domain-containing protein [Salibacterium halotolerans]
MEHSPLSKKAGNVPYTIFKKLFHTLIAMCNRPTRLALNLDKDLLVIDATMITVGENRLPWALYHGKRSGVKLHVAYTPSTGMPLQVEETRARKHDGPIGPSLNHRDSILVEDRAYFKIQRIDSFLAEEQSFVIRMKENVKIVRPTSLKNLHREDSRVTRDITCHLGSAQVRSKQRHRVVFFRDDYGNEIRVVTDLRTVDADTMAAIYREHWQIESFFRWIKQYLNIPTLFGTTPNTVFNQLYAALITHLLLRWLYQRTSKGEVIETLSFISFTRHFLAQNLPIDWLSEMAASLKRWRQSHGTNMLNDKYSIGVDYSSCFAGLFYMQTRR